MKRVTALAQRLLRVPLPLLCYGLVWVLWLLVCLFNLAGDGIGRASGALREMELGVQNAEPVNILELEGGVWLSTSDDPQLIWETNGATIRSFRFAAEISDEGHEMCLYYRAPGDSDFSEHKRVWPVQQADGSYAFTLPRTRIQYLRLDPVSVAGLEMDFAGVWVNEPQGAASYFNPGVWGLVWLLGGPALLAAALGWLRDTLCHYTGKRRAKRHKH